MRLPSQKEEVKASYPEKEAQFGTHDSQKVDEIREMVTTIRPIGEKKIKIDAAQVHSKFKIDTDCEMGSVTYQYGILDNEYQELIDHIVNFLDELKDIPEHVDQIQEKKVRLERKTAHEKIIVFDLDETLAHSTVHDKLAL